jgi:hypothetical protein
LVLSFRKVEMAALVFAGFATAASAQSVNQTSERDSLWNGTSSDSGLASGR